jgi:hypothetical protein
VSPYPVVEEGGVGLREAGGGDEGAEQREGHEAGGADGEPLSNGGGGVAGGVQRVRALADLSKFGATLTPWPNYKGNMYKRCCYQPSNSQRGVYKQCYQPITLIPS